MVKKVVAIFRPEINNGISGVVLFTQKTNGTQVELIYQVLSLVPNMLSISTSMEIYDKDANL